MPRQNAAIDLVVDLPHAPLIDLLSIWLDVYHVAKLDSAYCNKRRRPLLLQALAASYANDNVDTSDDDPMAWMTARKFKCTEVILHVDMIPAIDVLKSFLSTVGPAVTTFSVMNLEREVLQNTDVGSLAVQYCPKLRNLWCEEHDFICPSLIAIVAHCQFLKEVNLSGSVHIPGSLLAACFAAPRLEILDVSYCRVAKNCKDIEMSQSQSMRTLHATDTNFSEDILLQMCACSPQLTTLSLGPMAQRKGSLEVAKIAPLCPLLQTCTIIGSHAAGINAAAATIIAAAWTKLEELTLELVQDVHNERNVNVCSEVALLVLVQRCPQLRVLSTRRSSIERLKIKSDPLSSVIVGSSRLTDLQIGSISASSLQTLLAVCTSLHTLHIIHSAPTPQQHMNSTTMAEDALHLLHNSSVKSLMLEGILDLDKTKLARISHLQEIYLRIVRGDFDGQDILQLVKRCPELHTLVFAELPDNATHGLNIRHIIEACPKLTNFGFATSSGHGIDSTGMVAFCETIQHFYPQLKELILNF